MRDFTKLGSKTVQSLDDAAVKPDISANNLPKKGFITARMNKDNFWNLMFWVGMTLGIGITSVLDSVFDNKYLSEFAIWATILSIPYLVKRNSRIIFDKEKGFFNNEGKSLQNSYPKSFGLMIFIAIGVVILLGSIMHKQAPELNDSLARILIFGTFFGVITLYFILINTPISILFSKHFWFTNNVYLQAHNYSSSNNSESLTSPNNMYSNPVNSWYSGNIYHKK